MKIYVYNKKTHERYEIIGDVVSVEFRYNFFRVIYMDRFGNGHEALFNQKNYMITVYGY